VGDWTTVDFNLGLENQSRWVIFQMVTVLRAQGIRIIIFVNDHQPAHVHAFGDGQAKINLCGAGGAPGLVWVDGMTRGELRRVMKIVADNQQELLAKSRQIHG
jgi:hypothetical protein